MTKYEINRERYSILNKLLADQAEDFLNYLGLKWRAESNYMALNCPIHSGDSGSCLIFPEGDTFPGTFSCRTHLCEKIFGSTLLGFYRGILSAEEVGWSKEGDEIYPWAGVIEKVCSFLGVNFKKIHVDAEELDKRLYCKSVKTKREKGENKFSFPKSVVRDSLLIPSPYYMKRGFPGEILTRYDIGDCTKPGKPLSGRSVFPVYSSDGSRSVGFVGRSMAPLCEQCRGYHPPDIPCTTGSSWPKFKNLGNLGDFWYNYWIAKPKIEHSKVAIIVEGPGDVLSLEAAGIKGSLASFGTNISDRQLISLERLGVFSLILLHDNDSAGQQSKDKLVKKLSNCFHLVCPKLPSGSKDVGEIPPDQLKDLLYPIIKQIEDRYR